MTGLFPFIHLIWRRDRLRLTIWYGLGVLLAVGVAAAIGATYPTGAARAEYAHEINSSPAELFMIGRIHADSVAALAAWRVQGLVALILGVASVFTVIRHTRAAEDDGYREFLGAAGLGRSTPLAGSVIVAGAANLVAGAVIAIAYAALGFPIGGSLLTGAQFFAAGAFMTSVGAVAAMLAATSRGATSLAVVAMSVFYAIRGTADAAAIPALGWASPYGWLSWLQPYAADDGRPLLMVIAFAGAVLAAALRLSARDIGAGLLPERSGRSHASASLRGPMALAFRLSRSSLISWSLALFAFGGLIAALAESTARQLQESDALAGLADGPEPALSFIALVVYVLAQVVTLFGVQTVLRLRQEEVSGRAETVLAAPVSRLRWAGGALLTALAGTTVIQLSFGLGLGLTYAASTSSTTELPALIAATLVKLPAIWSVVGLAALLYGFVPRIAAPVAYIALGALFLLELLVELGYLDSAVLAISPYTQVPSLPGGPVDVLPTLVILGVTAVFVAGASIGLRRRDLTRV
ncbi:ABC transporter permease [Microbacterium sp. Marseille-Q6965]|uniref:ABC transporter permease n=1 Tax=Microbacterium sp. Marseille-Q6965 TaxID=2965072 RepID=UPI0021B7C4EA|nr:hypothetical protein [Microbacterium sp. Marseille-Q6965]